MNWALTWCLARFYRALFCSRVTSSPGAGGQHGQAGYRFIFLISISGLRPLARRFTSGRTRIGTTQLGLNTGGVETQVRLGINTQADDQRTLKRPIYYPAQPGRFSGLRLLARRFTSGRTRIGTTRLGLNTGGVETQHFTLAGLQTRSVQPNRPDSPRPDRF